MCACVCVCVCVCVCDVCVCVGGGGGGGRNQVYFIVTQRKILPPFLPLPPQAINNDGSLNTTLTSVVFTAKQNKTAARKDGTYVFLFLRHKTIEFSNL